MDQEIEKVLKDFERVSACWDIASSVRSILKNVLSEYLTSLYQKGKEEGCEPGMSRKAEGLEWRPC